MFLERLSGISGRIGGVVALSLVARDGMPVESVSSDPDLDLDELAAELITQLRVISDDHQELDVGSVKHLSVSTDRQTVMLSQVAEDYYLLLVLDESGSLGRARFELRRACLTFEDDLS